MRRTYDLWQPEFKDLTRGSGPDWWAILGLFIILVTSCLSLGLLFYGYLWLLAMFMLYI